MAAPFIGNNDYRGYLNSQAQNGNQNAATALNFVGNDGGINSNQFESYYDTPTGPGRDPERAAMQNYIASSYGDYNRLNSGGSGGGGGGSADPQAAAYYGDQAARINTQLGALDPQFNVGKQNILNSYNDQNAQLNLDQSRATRDYQTTRANTIADNQSAKQGIDTKVRSNTNALQRLLGVGGSGNSSAALEAAPFAAARAGTLERGQVQRTYGRNLQTADTNYGDYNQNVDISRADLAKQRDEKTNSLESGINQTRAQLLDTLASLTTQKGQAAGQSYTTAYAAAQPYVSQADALVGRVADLSRQAQNPGLQAAPVAYQAPNLASYDYQSTGGPTAGSDQPTYGDQVSPYSFLFGDKRKQQAF